MTALDSLKESNMWDTNYNLPTSPQNNNPWTYIACADLILKSKGEKIDGDSISKYYYQCLNADGTINRWPKSSSEISQDEIIGASYLFYPAALAAWKIIKERYGFYSNNDLYNANAFYARFPWFIVYLKYRATGSLTFPEKWIWNSYLLADLLTTGTQTNDASGRILIYIMSSHMQNIVSCKKIIDRWKKEMIIRGNTPKRIFSLEPKENPIMAELAPETW